MLQLLWFFGGPVGCLAVLLGGAPAKAQSGTDPIQALSGTWDVRGKAISIVIYPNHSVQHSWLGRGDIKWDNADYYNVSYRQRSLTCHYLVKRRSAKELEFITADTMDPSECDLGELHPDHMTEAAQEWQTIQNTDTEAVLEEFERRFSGTSYARNARARLQELRKVRQAAEREAELKRRLAKLESEAAQKKEIEEPVRAPLPTYWTHNGSLVRMVQSGSAMQILYQIPRSGMIEEGVTQGTVLFEGSANGHSYLGTAYVFSGRCRAAFPYRVTGEMANGGVKVLLTGKAPARIGADCKVVGYRDDVLIFERLN
jgi:hypothetical protein